MRGREATVRRGLLLVGGLTATTAVAVVAPADGLMMMFGATVTDPLALLIVRSWAFLVGLIGAGLMYAAFHAHDRRALVGLAAISKAGFVLLLVGYGAAYVTTTWPVVVADTVMTLFLLSVWGQAQATPAATPSSAQ